MTRIEKLQALLNDRSAFVIVDSKNRRYFTGMETSNGVLVVAKSFSVFMTDFRYITAAKANIKKPTEVALLSGSHSASVKKLFEEKRLDVKTVYFDESPKMSTYLVAVAVGLFDHIEETTADGMCLRQISFSFSLLIK